MIKKENSLEKNNKSTKITTKTKHTNLNYLYARFLVALPNLVWTMYFTDQSAIIQHNKVIIRIFIILLVLMK